MKNQEKVIGFYYKANDNEFGNNLRMEYSVDSDATIWQLHDLCKRFMIALGYCEETVEKAFGESVWEI